MRIAERFEEDVLVTAGHDHPPDDLVVTQQEVVENRFVVLVVHLELGCGIEAAGEHVRPGSLEADEVDGRCETRRPRMRPAPLPFRRGHTGAGHGVELVLLDET